MKRYHFGLLLCVLLGLMTGVGCKKKTDAAGTDPAAVEAAKKQLGADTVMAALDKKDYDGAMAALMKVRQAISNEEQQRQYMVLTYEVKQRLMADAANDPKAAQALDALRGMSGAR